MKIPLAFAGLVLAGCALLAGCDYESPLTSDPTSKVDPRLLGEWTPQSTDAQDEPPMHVRQWDDTHYAVAVDGEIYRAHHSDFAAQRFISAQDLNSVGRKYAFFVWSLSADGAQLTLRRVRTEVIPEKTSPAAALQELVKENARNPALLDKPLVFTRSKSK
jgi:hypothetical protein